jgi:hypothetical protein
LVCFVYLVYLGVPFNQKNQTNETNQAQVLGATQP